LGELRSRFERRKPQDPVTRRDESLAFVASDETWRSPAWFERVAVVLVEPRDPVNIGGVIRAMGNTGFLRLRLVRPVGFEPRNVIGIAHYTQHIVEATQEYETLIEAVADRHVVVGLTGKHQTVERNALPLQDAVTLLVEAATSGQRVAIVLGREDSGLSNAMLDACHSVTTIPTNPAYTSLNLAQAALLVLYQLFQRANGEDQAYRPPRRHTPVAPSSLLEDLFADLERALDAIEFLKLRSRTHTLRSLRVALYRARLSVREASLLRAVAIEVRRHLRRKGVLSEVGPIGARPPANLTPPAPSGILTPGSVESGTSFPFDTPITDPQPVEGQRPDKT
jgi:TrmH family RNA methyltransferase